MPGRDMRLSSGPDYSNANSWFPNIILPYKQMNVLQPPLTNTPRIGELVQNNQLMLSLQDAISLALENNMDIAVQRFTPWLDESNLLLAKSGINSRFETINGAGFDPIFSGSLLMEQITTPINNPFIAGVSSTGTGIGSTNAAGLVSHNVVGNFSYLENFHEGTQLSITFNNTRTSVNFGGSDLFNPLCAIPMDRPGHATASERIRFTVNDRYIIEAKNTVKVGQSQFAQAVIQDVTTTQNDYWELVYSIQNIKVEETTVAADQQLYENNKKQLEIGTLAPWT